MINNMSCKTRKEALINNFLHDEECILNEYELVELLLLINSANDNISENVKTVFAKFDNLSKLLNASFDDLCKIENFSKNNAAAVKIVAACARRAAEEALKFNQNSILDDWDLFLDFCRQDMAYGEVEELKIFLLDENMHYLANKTISKGTINQTVAHPREIIKIALRYNAKNIILAHNHPSGDCKPSEADIILTSDICSAALNSNIRVFDHLIITNERIFSFRNEGYFEKLMSR